MTRGDCPHCNGTGDVLSVLGAKLLCVDCGGTGLTAESLDAFHAEVDALSRAALAPWVKEHGA